VGPKERLTHAPSSSTKGGQHTTQAGPEPRLRAWVLSAMKAGRCGSGLGEVERAVTTEDAGSEDDAFVPAG
jgi:hypothetical protein